MMFGTLWTDGGSRGNPGLAAAGIVLKTEHETWERGWFLGTEFTNNEAEYRALALGMQFALGQGVEDLMCLSDSKLVVHQVAGIWRCKQPHLQELLEWVHDLRRAFPVCTLAWIPRDQNSQADYLANEAMDRFVS